MVPLGSNRCRHGTDYSTDGDDDIFGYGPDGDGTDGVDGIFDNGTDLDESAAHEVSLCTSSPRRGEAAASAATAP